MGGRAFQRAHAPRHGIRLLDGHARGPDLPRLGGGRLRALAVAHPVRVRARRRTVHRGARIAALRLLVFHVRGVRSVSPIANAANLGIIAAGLAVAAFIAVWIGLLVVIRKDSPLNVLTRCWASFIMFFAFEACALLIVLFGGLLGTV